MAATTTPAEEQAMSGELKIVLTCILLGAVGLTVGVITFSTLLPEIFGGRQGYVAGVVLVLLALAVLGLLQGAFECVLGDDLALPKHVAALGTLFVVVALNSAAVCVGANAMVRGDKPAAVVSLACVLALLSLGHSLLIRSQRRKYANQKEILTWLPAALASIMLPFVGFWISVGPGVHASAVAAACCVVALGSFAPLALAAPAFKRGRTAGLLQLLHALLTLISVLVTALAGRFDSGARSLVVWPCGLAGASVVHYLMTSAVRHPLFNKAESNDGGDGPSASLALLLHVLADFVGVIIVRCADPKAYISIGSVAIWVALLIGCGAYYSSPSDFLYVRRSMLALVFFATSFWTGRAALLVTGPVAVAAWWAMQMPWWRTVQKSTRELGFDGVESSKRSYGDNVASMVDLHTGGARAAPTPTRRSRQILHRRLPLESRRTPRRSRAPRGTSARSNPHYSYLACSWAWAPSWPWTGSMR
jgi:hypothetical protein